MEGILSRTKELFENKIKCGLAFATLSLKRLLCLNSIN